MENNTWYFRSCWSSFCFFKSKEVKELKKVIKENKKKEKKVEKQIKELEEAKTSSKKEVGNLKENLPFLKRRLKRCKRCMITMR